MPAGSGWRAGTSTATSQIVVRLFTWQQDGALPSPAMSRSGAAVWPQPSPSVPSCAWRRDHGLGLVYAESDGVPGLVVDRYGDWLVVQFLTLGVEVRCGACC